MFSRPALASFGCGLVFPDSLLASQANAFPTEMDETLRSWFDEKGGEIFRAEVSPVIERLIDRWMK